MKTIGIDLGTTNTVAAIDANVVKGVDAARAKAGGAPSVVPSVVAFPPSGTTIVGRSARRRRATDPKNTIYSAKRIMGQKWDSPFTVRFRSQYPFDLVDIDGRPCFRTRAGSFTPQEIGSEIIDYLLSSHAIDSSRYNAVIAVPPSFDEPSRLATMEAGLLAGFQAVSVVDEPVATSVAYNTVGGGNFRRVVVYDLGGGTFDLAIVDCSTSPLRVLHTDGDRYLGGNDIDLAIANWVADDCLEKHSWNLRGDAEVFDRLVNQCELAKIELASRNTCRIRFSQIDPAAPAACEGVDLSRKQLETLCVELVGRTFVICDQVMSESGMKVDDLDAVLLAGGATLSPMVREGVANYFGKRPRCDLDPIEVVGVGASLW